ncbi:MAG: polyketide synthase dehydratase domain-containing protein [Smithellaceae bacterium]
MENISCLITPVRRPWAIEVYPYLYDHHLEGRAVFPAAEALIELAKAVKINFPQATINNLTDAYFPRFLPIPEDAKVLAASVDIEISEADEIAAALFTSVKSKAGNISRSVEHARVKFAGLAGNQRPAHPFRDFTKLEGESINVPAAAIYRDLVPFGEAYQNISGDLSVSPAGALAYLFGGDTEADDNLLGSPFPFDAALHMACVWAQRFTDIVPFPIGFVKRTLYRKTEKKVTYLGRIAPVGFAGKSFVFDAWICDLQGNVCEEITGIQMQDVSGGRMKPPEWIKEL